MSPYQPLVEKESLALNRKQFLDRAVECWRVWLRRSATGRLSPADVTANNVLRGLIDRHADTFVTIAIGALARGETDLLDVLADRGLDYWLSRLDGSPARPPYGVQRSRRSGWLKPYGCILVTRPGRYGNPIGSLDGDRSFPVERFRNYLAARGRAPIAWPYHYPDDDTIVRELSYWDLGCWCRLSAPTDYVDRCHRDVLLRVAAGQAP